MSFLFKCSLSLEMGFAKPTEGFPGGSDGKVSAYNVGDLGSIPGLGRSPEGKHGNPLQYSCLENPHGQRNLMCYSPWGHKESDEGTTRRGTATPVHRPQRPAGSTHSSTRGLRPPEQLERPAGPRGLGGDCVPFIVFGKNFRAAHP